MNSVVRGVIGNDSFTLQVKLIKRCLKRDLKHYNVDNYQKIKLFFVVGISIDSQFVNHKMFLNPKQTLDYRKAF